MSRRTGTLLEQLISGIERSPDGYRARLEGTTLVVEHPSFSQPLRLEHRKLKLGPNKPSAIVSALEDYTKALGGGGMTAPSHRLPAIIRAELEGCSWVLENGARHFKLRIDDHLVAVIPHGSVRENNKSWLRTRADIRRHRKAEEV
jgi:hypothetical protein